MKKVGWEMQPLGWLLLIVVIATVCHALIRWTCRRSAAPDGKEAYPSQSPHSQ